MSGPLVNSNGYHISGTTAQRPGSAAVGITYFDTTLGRLFVYDGAAWVEAGAAAAGSGVGGDGSDAALAGGAGAVGTTTTDGGDGGDATIAAGAGGAKTDTGAASGGAGGAASLTSGVGGATASAGSDAAGAAGDVAITAGDGGAASAGTGDGGAGGDVSLEPGAGGTSAGGDAGAPGKIHLNGFVAGFKAQVIDMADAAVTLTRVPGTPDGTLLTGNILFVDPNGNNEDLLLPPEADMVDVLLIIKNTGGEHIVLKNDADGAVGTIEDAEAAIVHCDGTTWRIVQFVETT